MWAALMELEPQVEYRTEKLGGAKSSIVFISLLPDCTLNMTRYLMLPLLYPGFLSSPRRFVPLNCDFRDCWSYHVATGIRNQVLRESSSTLNHRAISPAPLLNFKVLHTNIVWPGQFNLFIMAIKNFKTLLEMTSEL